jgi:hypothetical protein
MASVALYRSRDPEDPHVYHDHSDCPTGQRIPPENRVSGMGGYPRCPECNQLD